MSLGAALSYAVTGLTATSRAAEVISTNVANALTPGYARRELQLTTRIIGGAAVGVQIAGVARLQDRVALAEWRNAAADGAGSDVTLAFRQRMETAFGLPTEAGSLSAQIDALDVSLIQAISTPGGEAALQALRDSATGLAAKMNTLTDQIQSERLTADHQIGDQVTALNTALKTVAELNRQIRALRLTSDDVTGLVDARQRAIDTVATIVPIRELPRDHRAVALYTSNGAMLLEYDPIEIGFTPVGAMAPDSTLASGALSGLTINGRNVAQGTVGMFEGGSLAQLFALRDVEAPALQSQIDAIARDLIDRFADPTLDPTLASGQPGLFTNAGMLADPLAEVGLAGRLAVNSAVDPTKGGALWRLRDGIGAAMQGPSGNSALLQALSERLREARVPASGAFLGAARSSADLAADLLSQVTQSRLSGEDVGTAIRSRLSAAEHALSRDGVDTDQEMQALLIVQQAYAANARVIASLDEMFRQLVEI